MVFGDPNKFAILMELIPYWTRDGSYKNGLFHFIIDGKIFPTWSNGATHRGDIHFLADDSALFLTPENKQLFSADKRKVFTELMNGILPYPLNADKTALERVEKEQSFQASAYNLEADSCFVFAIGHKENIRLLAAKKAYLYGDDSDGGQGKNYDRPDIEEIILPKTEVRQIVKEVKAHCANK